MNLIIWTYLQLLLRTLENYELAITETLDLLQVIFWAWQSSCTRHVCFISVHRSTRVFISFLPTQRFEGNLETTAFLPRQYPTILYRSICVTPRSPHRPSSLVWQFLGILIIRALSAAEQYRWLKRLPACEDANNAGSRLRLGPELEIPGYGCADHFFEIDTEIHSWEILKQIVDRSKEVRSYTLFIRRRVAAIGPSHNLSFQWPNLLIVTGMPVRHRMLLYNCLVSVMNGYVLLEFAVVASCTWNFRMRFDNSAQLS